MKTIEIRKKLNEKDLGEFAENFGNVEFKKIEYAKEEYDIIIEIDGENDVLEIRSENINIDIKIDDEKFYNISTMYYITDIDFKSKTIKGYVKYSDCKDSVKIENDSTIKQSSSCIHNS
jgi:hypothetical protein